MLLGFMLTNLYASSGTRSPNNLDCIRFFCLYSSFLLPFPPVFSLFLLCAIHIPFIKQCCSHNALLLGCLADVSQFVAPVCKFNVCVCVCVFLDFRHECDCLNEELMIFISTHLTSASLRTCF